MLKDYLWESFAIAEQNGADVGAGRDMLCANIEKGQPVEGQPWYAGAEELDYPALHERWSALTAGEQTAARQEAADLVGEHYHALASAWRGRDRGAFGAVLAEGV